MSKNEWKKRIAIAGRVLLAYALVFVQGTLAAQNEQAKDKPAGSQNPAVSQNKVATQNPAARQKVFAAAPTRTSAESEESESAVRQEKKSGEGEHEGIKVHGHWTVEVKNPDGKVVTHREFENSYQPSGGVLPSILTRSYAVGSWEVLLKSGICGGNVCTITETNSGISGDSGNLQFINTGPQLGLSGTLKAAGSGVITQVQTLLGLCSPYMTTSGCATSGLPAGGLPPPPPGFLPGQNILTFTLFDLSSNPISASTGQIVAVTVNISFS